jgi:hypothetical protein
MPFVRKNLERMAGGIQKLYHFNAVADSVATATASGYFNEIADEVDAGDIILVKASNLTTLDNVMVSSARGVTPVTVVVAEGITAT